METCAAMDAGVTRAVEALSILVCCRQFYVEIDHDKYNRCAIEACQNEELLFAFLHTRDCIPVTDPLPPTGILQHPPGT